MTLNSIKPILAGMILTIIAFASMACGSDASVVSHNVSKAADNFEVQRRIVFFNGITDTYMLTIEGRCSIEDQITQLEVTCKLGENEFRKHFLGLSDNVTYFVEQTHSVNANEARYRVVFKPSVIIPDVDVR